MMLVLAALMLFVSCKKDPEVTNADRFLESYNAADFVLNAYVGGVHGYSERSNQGAAYYPMNTYYQTYYADPLMHSFGNQYLSLFTNKAKTKRVGISEFTNYSTTQAVNGQVYDKYLEVGADNVNLAFKYKDQTSSDGTTWTDSSDEKTGYFLCNAKRTKEQVGDTTSTIYKYTVTDIKLSVKKVNGEWLDVSSKDEIEYKSITYEMDGTDLSTLSNLTYDGSALTSTEIKAVIDALTK